MITGLFAVTDVEHSARHITRGLWGPRDRKKAAPAHRRAFIFFFFFQVPAVAVAVVVWFGLVWFGLVWNISRTI